MRCARRCWAWRDGGGASRPSGAQWTRAIPWCYGPRESRERSSNCAKSRAKEARRCSCGCAPGRVTTREAARLAGVSEQVVRTRIASGLVPFERNGRGHLSLAREDVRLIKRRPPAKLVKNVPVRIDLDLYAAWQRAAGERSVRTWLAELGDGAAGVARTR